MQTYLTQSTHVKLTSINACGLGWVLPKPVADEWTATDTLEYSVQIQQSQRFMTRITTFLGDKNDNLKRNIKIKKFCFIELGYCILNRLLL